ncbi:MAG TPA: histidine kinase [Acidimicrobiales bacterium]|nr:histidine kinase [Acidimicrobiales bacterium]
MRAVFSSSAQPEVNWAEVGTNGAGLGLLVYGIVTTGDIRKHGGLALALPLLALCVLGWAMWLLARARRGPEQLRALALTTIAAAGGALVGVAPLAMVFAAVATMGACSTWPVRRAIWIGAGGLAASAVSVPVAGRTWSVWLGALSAVLAGSIIGVNRRIAHERSVGEAAIEVARARADAESARAELLAGRNHMARELHDVLAHTLSALSLQLEALGAQMEGADPNFSSKLVEIKGLVREGLYEARGAVAALREELPPLDERLVVLAAQRGATLEVAGNSRPLPGDVALPLYRVVQEALTNVAKHARGVRAVVELAYEPDAVVVCITNAPPPTESEREDATVVAGAGRGYGLQGIRERVLLIGGSVEAGPLPGGGWRVHASAPVTSGPASPHVAVGPSAGAA